MPPKFFWAGTPMVKANDYNKQQQHSYGVVFDTHRFAAFCELTAVTIEGKQLDHISRNVREVLFRRAQRVSLNRRYGESNQVVLHVSRECYH